jgi:hypothetical protein
MAGSEPEPLSLVSLPLSSPVCTQEHSLNFLVTFVLQCSRKEGIPLMVFEPVSRLNAQKYQSATAGRKAAFCSSFYWVWFYNY